MTCARTSKLFSSMLLVVTGCGTFTGNPIDQKKPTGAAGTQKEQPEAAPASEVATITPTTTTTTDAKGTLDPRAVVIALTDAPIDDVKQVFVTIARVELIGTDGKAREVPLVKSEEVDLVALDDGKSVNLAEGLAIPPGTYSQVRLVLDATKAPRVVTADGKSEALKVPSGTESGIKVVGEFIVKAGVPLKLTIDFDLRKSLKRVGESGKGKEESKSGGSYEFKPVIRVVEDSKTATITGAAPAGAKVVCAFAVGSTKDATEECGGAINAAKVKDGKYTLAFMPEGKYELRYFFGAGGHQDKTEPVEIKKNKQDE